MNQRTTIRAERREAIGSAAAHRLRRRGKVPAVVYGHKEDVVPVQLGADDVHHLVAHRVMMLALDMGDSSEQVLVKEVQFDPFGEEVLHLDFERIAMDEEVEIECPVEFVGTAKGVAAGGVPEHPVADLTVRCLPGNIPENIKVQVSELEIGDTITVADIEAPEGVELLTEPEAVLLTIRPPEELEEEEEELLAEEPELIGREEEEEAAAEEEVAGEVPEEPEETS
ncbi:MAG: 50S ribosomal protein L25 [Planctomycetota bacterium]